MGAWAMPQSAAVFLASLATSILFLLLGPYSNFSAAGYLDPWIYTGYFTHFSYLVQHWGLTYYVSRLPWIVPGLLVFKVATPAAASVLLNALIMASSVTALYFIVFWHYGTLPAILSCIALMTNPYFVYAVAWDYPDGPAIAYALLGLACFLRPAPRLVPSGVAGGAFLALSGYTNLAGLPVLLGMLMIPLWRYRQSFKRLVREAFHILLGGSAVTLLFAIIGKLLLNTYLFFMPQIDMILYTRAHPDYLRNMWGAGYAWIPGAFRLFPPLFIIFLGGILLVKQRRRSDAYLASYLCLVTTCLLFCIFEFGFHNVGLRVAYCSTYVTAPLLAFTGLLIGETFPLRGKLAGQKFAGASRGANPEPSPVTRVIWIAVGLFGLALPFYYRYGARPAFSRSQLWTGMLVVGLLAATCLVLIRGTQVFAAALAYGLILAGLFTGPAYDGSLSYIWSAENAATFQTVMRIEQLVSSGVSPARQVRFWYDNEEPALSPPPGAPKHFLFDSAYSLYLWGYFDFSKELPSGPAEEIRRLVDSNTTFVHLTTNTASIATRTQLLSARGIVAGNERRWTIPSRYGNISVVLQDVLDDSRFH